MGGMSRSGVAVVKAGAPGIEEHGTQPWAIRRAEGWDSGPGRRTQNPAKCERPGNTGKLGAGAGKRTRAFPQPRAGARIFRPGADSRSALRAVGAPPSRPRREEPDERRGGGCSPTPTLAPVPSRSRRGEGTRRKAGTSPAGRPRPAPEKLIDTTFRRRPWACLIRTVDSLIR